jgi:putative CocE/NonD family hydrolase
VLISLSAYQKNLDRILPHVRPFTHVERPEPDWWVPRGYVLVFIDTRGTGESPGKADIWSMQESRDYYDAIEWAARQDWSSGKVGLSGVSYYAITQWNVAGLQPPSLTTIVPWEGWADLYRDSVFHGGILNQAFYGRWWIDVVGKQLLEEFHDPPHRRPLVGRSEIPCAVRSDHRAALQFGKLGWLESPSAR